MKKGKIDTSKLNTLPEKHEYDTAKYFADRGFDVSFIKPSSIKNQHSPDFLMVGKEWETKSPVTYGRASFEHIFRKASKQSCHIIYDLRRLPDRYEQTYITRLRGAGESSRIKTLLVITKDGRLLTIKGNFGKIGL